MDLRDLVAETGRRNQGLVTARALHRAGVSRSAVSRAVSAGAVIRVCARVYGAVALPTLPRFVVTDAGVSPAYVAHVRAVLLSLGASATACLRTAAALYGWGLLVEPGRSVDIAVPHGRSGGAHPLVHATQRRRVERAAVVVVPATAPLWVTSPVQTVVDCALRLPLMQSVVVCDSALRAGHVTLQELVRAIANLRGLPAAHRARDVVGLCDPLSGSVLESVMRVRMVLAGITGFTTQRVISGGAAVHIRVDFCFATAGLVVEVDGFRWHQDPARDRLRDNALAALGWRVLRFTWAEVMHDPERVLGDVRAALACETPTVHVAARPDREAA